MLDDKFTSNKKLKDIAVKDGSWDYTDEAENKNTIEELDNIKDELRNEKKMCPSCKTGGFFFKEFMFKGKDKAGLMYFQCLECKNDIQYDILNGNMKIQKGLFGFLFGKFS